MWPLHRTRRLRWGDAASSVEQRAASAWFQPGDAFAVAADPPRLYAFPAPPLAWQAGIPWNEERDDERFRRLPKNYDLERIRQTRIAIIGLGHVGGAVLEQLAPLPWAGFLLIDRDAMLPHNFQSHPLAAADPGLAPLQENA